MANQGSRTQTPGADTRQPQTGVFVEYTDSGGTVAGVVTAQCGGLVGLTSAGLAAFLAQAAAYLTSGKVTSITATGAALQVTGTLRAVSYSCLAADAATQIAALQALVISANVVQTVQTVH
jgi:hypothetical protein